MLHCDSRALRRPVAVRTFITACGEFDNPVSHFRTALLTVATALSVVFCMLLFTLQPETDTINVNIGMPGDGSPALQPPLHQLVIDKQGRMMMDGVPVADYAKLRELVDAQQLQDPERSLRRLHQGAVRHQARSRRTAVYRLALARAARRPSCRCEKVLRNLAAATLTNSRSETMCAGPSTPQERCDMNMFRSAPQREAWA